MNTMDVDNTDSVESRMPSKQGQHQGYHEILKWSFVVINGRLIIEGFRKDCSKKWHSGRIVRILSPTLVQTKSNSVYCLVGPPDHSLMTSFNLTQDIYDRFINGLPHDWKLYLSPSGSVNQLLPIAGEDMLPSKCGDQPPSTPPPPIINSCIPSNSTPIKQCPPTSTPKSNPTVKLNKLQITPSTSVTEDPFLSSLKRSFSGRLIKPVLFNVTEKCCAYSYSVYGDLMGVSRPLSISSKSEMNSSTSTRHNTSKTQRDYTDEQHLSSVDISSKITTHSKSLPLDNSSEMVRVEQQAQPPASAPIKYSRKPRKRRRVSYVPPSRRRCSKSAIKRGEMPKEIPFDEEDQLGEHQRSRKEEDEHLLLPQPQEKEYQNLVDSNSLDNSVWTKESNRKLKSVVSYTPAMSDDFWHDVSMGMGESFSAEECQNQYLQITRSSHSQENNSGSHSHLQVVSKNNEKTRDSSDVDLLFRSSSTTPRTQSLPRKPMNDSIINRYKRLSELKKLSANTSSEQNDSSREYSGSRKVTGNLLQLVFSDASDEEGSDDAEDLLTVNATYKKIMTEFSY